jgi:hypothetical protein
MIHFQITWSSELKRHVIADESGAVIAEVVDLHLAIELVSEANLRGLVGEENA